MRVSVPRVLVLAIVSAFAFPAVSPAVTLNAPASVAAGSVFTVTWSGDGDPTDFITLVPVGTPEGKYGVYGYANQPSFEIRAPDEPGPYELRYLVKDSPYPTQARIPMTVTPVTATLAAPASSPAGTTIAVTWTGPDNPRDFITIVAAGAAAQTYAVYAYTSYGNPVQLQTPDAPGAYEIRYLTGQNYYTLASVPLAVQATGVSLTPPERVAAGAAFTAAWTGPDNPRDYIGVYAAGDTRYLYYAYTSQGTPAGLRAPDAPGSYELRYVTGQTETALATAPFTVTATEAAIIAPAEVRGGDPFSFSWTGPDNAGDFVGMAAPDAPEPLGPHPAYVYTREGNPGTMTAPLAAGSYELRYVTGQSAAILARVPIRVTPPAGGTGTLYVVGSSAGVADGAVELILDASGSMLQKQGGKRRIDIAKEVILGLVGHDIPAGTPFALRVFGHKEKDSCRTDLEIPLRPLDAASVTATVNGLTAMNLAKTPIARSLELTADDLAGAGGSRAVVLITDGEETCGGDPPAVIEALHAAGLDVRVSIVGFAVETEALKQQFRYWVSLGGGGFYDAADAATLGAGLSAALRAPYDVLDANGARVAEGLVGGPGVPLPAGEYRIRTRAQPAIEASATIEEGKGFTVTLPR